jgi:hypothetical protein
MDSFNWRANQNLYTKIFIDQKYCLPKIAHLKWNMTKKIHTKAYNRQILDKQEKISIANKYTACQVRQ